MTCRPPRWIALALVCALAGAVTAASQSPTAAGAAGKKIVFLAGPKDHGVEGRHEHEKDLRILAGALGSAANLKGISTEVHVGKAPRDPAVYANAAAIVIESSSDRDAREIHPLSPPEQETTNRTYDQDTLAFLKMIDGRMRSGMGVVVLHRDEVFCRFFLPPDLKRIELIVGTPAKATIGPQLASWAYERDGGGRAFVMGGADFHDNMTTVADYRRFLLNGIVWAAGMDVPPGGIDVRLP